MNAQIFALLRHTPAFRHLSDGVCMRLLELSAERLLESGEILTHEGDTGSELFLVISGSLQLTRKAPAAALAAGESTGFRGELNPGPPDIRVGQIGPGELIGELSLLSSHPYAMTVMAEQDSHVRSLASASFEQLCGEHPGEMAETIAWIAERLDQNQIAAAIEESQLLRQLPATARADLASGFVRIDLAAGSTLFREGQAGDALYLILSGRMKIVTGIRVQGELGKGDLLGELSLLTGEVRSDSALAIRDTHLARLSKSAFDRILAAYPSEMLSMFTRQLARRLQLRNADPIRARSHGFDRESDNEIAEGRVPVAIAVLPLNPLEQAGGGREFASELTRQLSAFGPTLHLNRAIIARVFPEQRNSALTEGQNSRINEVAERRLVAWLDEMEMLYRHVVYEADYQTGRAESAWTQRCLRQADALLMIAGGPADPKESERTMVRLSSKALPSVKTTLVLVHAGAPDSVSYTRIWKNSLGIVAHEHVRREGITIHAGDVGRVARKLNRKSVGLVLGGGFALGLAHIGVIDAMRELDIPIDFVGGTSMGAIIAAAGAMEFTHDQMLEVMDKGCAQALKGDYTLPIVSLLTGKKVTLALGKYLEGKDIEDFWLPYFAISASLVKARMVVHREGNALRSVLASCRAPGMFPPLGWDGDVLVDGGLVNNIPADVMRESVGSGLVFAADVSPDAEFTSRDQFGMDLSGWRVARRNISPLRRFKKPKPDAKHATIADILMRLIRMGGVAHNQQIRASADLYMSLPLEDFSVKDFHRGEEMAKAGYESAIQQLSAWIADHGRPWLGGATSKATFKARSKAHPRA